MENSFVTYGATLSHFQFVNCIRGIVLTGSGSGSGSGTAVPLTVNNALMSGVQYPFTANTAATGNLLRHCTINESTRLITATAASGFSFVNSVFGNVPSPLVSGPASLSGGYNGFYPDEEPRKFGSPRWACTESPFEPSMVNGVLNIATWQGRHYLAENEAGDSFRDVGTTAIPSTLRSELRRRTTSAPGLLDFSSAFTEDTTLSPYILRDTNTPDLGYHYPVLDYLVAGATVNNARLTLKEGLALAFTFPFVGIDFGLRVNGGGRLVSEGSPTNFVVLTRAQLVQEMPQFLWDGLRWDDSSWWPSPILAARAMAEPLPEMRFRFTDFPSSAGDYWVYGPQLSTWQSSLNRGEQVGVLEFQDCQFHGGVFLYESGYNRPRVLTFRNSLFERVTFWLWDLHSYVDGGPDVSETFTAWNNLLYGGTFDILPCWDGNDWTIVDNVFDKVELIEDRAPAIRVSTHHHNAYVDMQASLSSPTTPNPGDKTLSSLSYSTGPLGRYYLPSSATELINQGSRAASDAGLFHFTSLTSQVKEGSETVNIGLHYVALVNGKVADSDGSGDVSDRLPDWVEDANGDGIPQSTESNWQVRESTPVRILGSLGGTSVSAIIQVPVQFDNTSGNIVEVRLVDDNNVALPAAALTAPYSGSLLVDLDTRKLANGPLTMKAAARFVSYDTGTYMSVTSDPVTVTVNNDLHYPDWNEWTGEDWAAIKFRRNTPFSYGIAIFDYDYPWHPSPEPVAWLEGQSSDGRVAQPWDLVDTFTAEPLNDGAAHPRFFLLVYPDVDPPVAPPKHLPALKQGQPFPEVGGWYVAYEDSMLNVFDGFGNWRPVRDPLDLSGFTTWWQDGFVNALPGFAAYGSLIGRNALVYWYPPNPGWKHQSFPIRFEMDYRGLKPASLPAERLYPSANMWRDWRQFRDVVANPLIRNLYISAHMTEHSIGIVDSGCLRGELNGLRPAGRYHFIWLDGCQSGARLFDGGLLRKFGFHDLEVLGPPLPISYYRDCDNETPGDQRLRPGGGIAYELPFTGAVATPQDPNYAGYLEQEYARFNIAIRDNWTFFGMGLQEAVDRAVQAPRPATSLLLPPWRPNCIRAFGYADLHFNEFNRATDTWL